MDSIVSWPGHPAKQATTAMPRRGTNLAPAIRRRKNTRLPPSADVPSLIRLALGPLECEVLQQVCAFGESTARQVLERISRPLAYTTVMTTMTRLYRKGLLSCRMSGKTFFYSSRLSAAQLQIQLARDLVRALVACKDVPGQELAAAVVEAMHQERPEMLQELNRAMHEHASRLVAP